MGNMVPEPYYVNSCTLLYMLASKLTSAYSIQHTAERPRVLQHLVPVAFAESAYTCCFIYSARVLQRLVPVDFAESAYTCCFIYSA